MAISALTVWEVNPTGLDANGGGFVAGSSGTDKTYVANGASVPTTHGTLATQATATQISSGTAFVAADVGNIIQIAAAAGWTAGFYQILSVAAGIATLDSAPAAALTAGGSGVVGGALLTLGAAFAAQVGGNRIELKSGTYTTAVTINATASGGDSPTLPPNVISGYYQVRGDIGYGPKGANAAHRPTITATAAAVTVLNIQGNFNIIENVIVDGGSFATTIGIQFTGNYSFARGCLARNCTSSGFYMNSSYQHLEFCEAYGMLGASSVGINVSANIINIYGCSAHDNAGSGIALPNFNTNVNVFDCLIANNAGVGISMGGYGVGHAIIGNQIVGNGSHGISNPNPTLGQLIVKNNVIADNGGFGWLTSNTAGYPDSQMFDGNAYANNTSGTLGNLTSGALNFPAYTHAYDVVSGVDQIVSHAAGTANFPTDNFGLIVGSPARAAGWLSQFPGNTATTNNRDMGAAQSQSVASVTMPPGMFRVVGNAVLVN